MILLTRARKALLALLFAAVASHGETTKTLELVGRSTVDPAALTFADGSATRFGNVVNGRTHQQWPLVTHRGHQYATWFDAKRQLCIARRKLPSTRWKTIRFTDHRFKTNDSHNTAVLGICDTDGTIHLAFDHHASRLNYRVSKLGVANRPEDFRWDASLFSPIFHTLGSVKPHDKVTYPRFFAAPNGNLMLYYRSVTSANGDGMIEEYNGDRHDWTPGLGKFISRDIGTFKLDGRNSKFRCPYLNSISYAGDRLHVSWVWRDRFEKTSARHNHSLCYIYSDDHGRTWHNSAGKVIGKTGRTPVHLDTPGLVVAPIPAESGLSNQNTHYAYPDGSIHAVMLHQSAGSRRTLYQHHWRTPDGQWKSETLPFRGTRPTLVGAPNQSLVLAYSDNRNQLQIVTGIPNRDRSGWKWTHLTLPRPHSCYGDALLDPVRWETDGILSIYSQEPPSKILSTRTSEPKNGLPSALQVTDYCLRTMERP